MTENWDKFEPFKGVQKQGFSFQPSRYQTWIGGKMVDSGIVSANVSAKVVNQNSSEKMSVTFNEMNLESEISSELLFDEFDEMIGRQFFMPEKTLENVIKSGIENHSKLLDYLENRVMNEEDVDF